MPRNEEKKAFMGIGRLCVVLVIALLLAWFLLPVFRGIVNIGNAAGILLCSFALWLAGYPGAAGCLSSLWGHPGGKVLLSAASRVPCVWSGDVLPDGRRDSPASERKRNCGYSGLPGERNPAKPNADETAGGC